MAITDTSIAASHYSISSKSRERSVSFALSADNLVASFYDISELHHLDIPRDEAVKLRDFLNAGLADA